MWWLLVACVTPQVLVQGRVTAERGSELPLGDATMELRSGDFGLFDTTTTDSDGWFSVRAPYQDLIYLVLSGEGTVPISIGGTSGTAELLVVPEGQLWGFPPEEEQEWREDFAGCPGVELPGLIVGEVRVNLVGSSNPDGNPIDENGFVFILDEDGERTDACYLDASGVYDPAAEIVGTKGRFAIFGAEGGPLTLRAGRRVGDMSVLSEWAIYVPEGGVVSIHPALIGL